MEDVLAELQLSQLLTIAMAVAQTDRAAPFRVGWMSRQDALKRIQVLRGAQPCARGVYAPSSVQISDYEC